MGKTENFSGHFYRIKPWFIWSLYWVPGLIKLFNSGSIVSRIFPVFTIKIFLSIFSGFLQNIFLFFQKKFIAKNFLKTENFNRNFFLVLAFIGLSPELRTKFVQITFKFQPTQNSNRSTIWMPNMFTVQIMTELNNQY